MDLNKILEVAEIGKWRLVITLQYSSGLWLPVTKYLGIVTYMKVRGLIWKQFEIIHARPLLQEMFYNFDGLMFFNFLPKKC